MMPKAWLAAALASSVLAEGTNFAWREITPTADLRYHDCYDGFKCAGLEVPLDWQDPDNPGKVALALIKLPATVPEDDPSFGGTIIANPGGPGGSGISLIRGRGRHLQLVVDRNKHYEILSFDPRGVGESTPAVDCLGDSSAQSALAIERNGIGGLDFSLDSLRRHFVLTKAYGTVCNQTDQATDILRYVSTASVCRDMVEMIDRIDELRQRTTPSDELPVQGAAQHPMIGLGPDKDVARLQFIGFSYGTVLGNTFASMYPGRVGRLVIDGVVDSYDYVKGAWLTFLQDTEKVIDYFYETCHEAGSRCKLWKKSDKTWGDIKKRVDDLIAARDANPVSFIQGKQLVVITGNDIRNAFLLPAYAPIQLFDFLADSIASALEGNYTLVKRWMELPSLQDACALPNTTMPTEDALPAISCSDADDHSGYDVGFFANYIDELKAQSPIFGARWSQIRFACSGWTVRPKWRFDGPFTSPRADPGLKKGKPAAPLLFLTNKLDPVTPRRNAYTMSAGHPGSAVVVQDSVGHCAIAGSWSECTNEILRDYFEFGVVPRNDTRCPGDCKPWKEEQCGPPEASAFRLTAQLIPFSGRLPLELVQGRT